jgi:hydroxymethylpyrimidine pyrophosphatase-like HAD family hydrolase
VSVRVVYSDLDGTMVGPLGCFFLTAGLEPTLAPAQALVELLSAGTSLVLVSGRTRAQLEEACRIFGADGFVGELGAVVGWDHGLEHTVLRGAMPETYDGTLVAALARDGLVEQLLMRYAGRLEYHAPWHHGHEADIMLRGHVELADAEAWLAAQGYDWLRMRDNGVLPAEEYGNMRAPVHVYHLMADGLSKGGGVAADLARRGLTREDAVAIGDSVSDLSMAPYVRRFFLVANGAKAGGTAAAAGEHPNVTVCHGEVGLGWVEAIRWALSPTPASPPP